MCGACGTAAPDHWSEPFLASQPARATAARAVGAMIGQQAVLAAPGGFLVRRPTGATVLAPHLGAVWRALDRLGAPRPAPGRAVPPVTGPATLPAVRPTPVEIQLVLSDDEVTPRDGHAAAQPHPQAADRHGPELHVDARGIHPHDLPALLHDLAASTAGNLAVRRARLVLANADLPRTVPHLLAAPTAPYQLWLSLPLASRRCAPPEGNPPLRPPGSNIPALLAWASGHHGQGHPDRLAVELSLDDERTFHLHMLHGVVTRCSVQATHPECPAGSNPAPRTSASTCP